MLNLIAFVSIDTIIEANLPYFAIGHISLVLVLLFILFSIGKKKSVDELTKQDDEIFDYITEKGMLFKPTAKAASAEDPSSDTEDTKPNIDESIVLDDEVNEGETPPESETVSPETEASAEPESETSTPEDTEKRRQDRINEILSRESENGIILINRDEKILDLNSKAFDLIQFTKEDLSGKKIDEIIFLESSDNSDGDPNAQQTAKGQKKNGEHFPVSVELEMADREFGIITVTLYPLIDPSDIRETGDEEPTTGALDESSEEPTPTALAEEAEQDKDPLIGLPETVIGLSEPETETESEQEAENEVKTESEPEPVVAEPEPAVSLPLPPPPPPKDGPRKPLTGYPHSPNALVSAGITGLSKSSKPLDNNTIEMFSTQLSQPLQSIVQLAELISSDANAIPLLKKYAIAIQAKSNRMMSQIDEISTLVSAQRGQIQMLDKPFNLSKMIAGLIDLATSVMIDQKQKIHYTCDEQDLIVVSDEEHFEKILSNLINVTLQAAEEKDTSLSLKSILLDENQNPDKKISYEGRELQIGSTRQVIIRAEFPTDANTNHIFDITISRVHDNAIIQNAQNNGALKNYISSLRLVKELVRVMRGKMNFIADDAEKGVIEISLELQCAQVGSYPA